MIQADPDRELAELREYLGPAYDQAALEAHKQGMEDELARIGDEARLYRESEGYLYDLTVFAMSGTKVPYLDDLCRIVPPPARMLDYGCGIGSDGLLLLEHGYEVAFADFDNPSTRYLRWRLQRRGFHAEIYDLDRERPPASFDVAYAFDVIEHVDDPYAFLLRMEECARLVLVNLLEYDPEDVSFHRRLPIRGIVARAAMRGIVHYRRYYNGEAHLVLYRSRPGRPRERLASAGALLAGLRTR